MGKSKPKDFKVQEFLSNNSVINAQGDKVRLKEQVKVELCNKPIKVPKIYTYTYPKRLKSGKTVIYKYKYAKFLVNRRPINNEIYKVASDIKDVYYGLNVIKRLLNGIIANKCYNSSNMTKRISNLENKGFLTPETKKLMTRAYTRQYKLASELEEMLWGILNLYDASENEIKEIKKEISELVKK